MKTSLLSILWVLGFLFLALRVSASRRLSRLFLCWVFCGALLSFPSATKAFDLTQIKTVFLIPLENHDWTQSCPTCSPQQIKNNPAAPFINSLVTPGHSNAVQVSYSAAYYEVAQGNHPSEPNYIWSEAGTQFGVHTDNDPSFSYGNLYTTANHLSRQLTDAGIVWKDYQEDLEYCSSPAVSAAGTRPSGVNAYNGSTRYDRGVKHDPMQFFTDTQGKNVYSLAQFWIDLANNAVGRYNWITPDQYNEMHSGLPSFTYHGVQYSGNQSAIASGDNFLSIVVPQIMASAAYQDHGVIIIWTDETESTDDTGTTLPYIVISPMAKGNAYASSVVLSHSSTLKTMDEIFGLAFQTNAIVPASKNAQGTGYNYVATVNDISDMFITTGPPTIATQPKNVVAPTGGNASFTVVASGIGPFSYQWQKGGSPLGGATAATLSLTGVQSSDQAGYNVIVTNPYGSATSALATLTVIVPPAIVDQPQGTNVLAGSTVTFSVSATGGQPLSYQWLFKGGAISGATSPSLTLNNVQLSNAGNYSVRVTNQVGSVLSANANLTVISGPTITVVATDPFAAEAGLDPGTFTITRSGSTTVPVTVYFTMGGSATPDMDYIALSSPVTIQAGAASTNLTVTPIDDLIAEPAETVILTLAAGTGYVIGSSSNATVFIADNDNIPPSVTITNPANDATFTTPVNIAIGATATDIDGFVAQVDFYLDGTNKLGTATTAPFGLTWTNALPGTHSFTAIATDNLGGMGTSGPVNIAINGRPVVSIVDPPNGASFVAPANLVISVNATDDGSVALVEVFVDGNLLGSATSGPYSFPWTNVAIGSYVLTARATDNQGVVGLSAPSTVVTHEPTPNFGDNFSERGVVKGFTNFVYGDSSTYTREPGEPYHDGDYGTASAWVSWTAPASGTCTMTTTTNGLTGVSNVFDTVVAVYTGDVVSQLTYVASNDDAPSTNGYTSQSRVSFPAVDGTTYQIAVDGYGAGQGGSIYFRLNLPVGPLVVEQPQTQVANPGSNAVFHVTANGTTPVTYQWLFNGTAIFGATNSTFTALNVQYTNAGSYSVLVGNTLGFTNSQPAVLVVRPTIISGILTNGTFRLTFNGTPGMQYAIEVAPDLLDWSPLATVTNSTVKVQYIDPSPPISSPRVYRLRLLP